MNADTLIAVNIGLPVLSALASLLLGGRRERAGIVYMTAAVLVASSLLLHGAESVALSPSGVFGTAVVVLDFALLLYFLYVGYVHRSWQVLALSIAQLLPAAYFEFFVKSAHVENVLVVDGLSIMLTLIINIVGSLVLVYALSYMDEHESHLGLEQSRQGRFFFYMLLLLGAMNGLVYSNSLYWLYFFWEVTTLCCYELIRHDGTHEAQGNALLALWMGLIGGVAFVAAMYVGYGGHGGPDAGVRATAQQHHGQRGRLHASKNRSHDQRNSTHPHNRVHGGSHFHGDRGSRDKAEDIQKDTGFLNHRQPRAHHHVRGSEHRAQL